MLTISWTRETTERQPEGGDISGYTFDQLQLDIVETDSYEAATTYTSHTVESGIPVADNATPEADRYSATVYISERPATLGLVDGTTMAPTDIGGGRSVQFVTPPDGTTRTADALERLLSLMREATLVTVEGGRRTIEDWVIDSISTPRTIEDAGALIATITFREWRVATLEDVDAPSPRVERGRRRTNRGNQTTTSSTTTTTPAQTPAERQSAAEYFREQLSEIMSGRSAS